MSELTPEEFLKDFTKSTNGKIAVTLLSILGILLASWIIDLIYREKKQRGDFFKQEVNGILIRSKDIYRGMFKLTIRQHHTEEEVTYSLSISKFLRDYNIQIGDSISKDANSRTIEFFRKSNGTFSKCCDLYVD